MLDVLNAIFSSEPFVPHGHCYLWKTGLVGLHITTDALIALAYYSIPIALFYFTWRREDLPFKQIFFLFGAFIISCGTTHLLEIWTLWHPVYWLSGGMKAITALISVFTAIKLIPLVPQVLALPSPVKLQQLNEELQISQARFAGILDIASDAIISINVSQHITLFNRAAEKVFGYTAEEAVGQPLNLLLPQRFSALHHQHLSNFKEQNGNTRRMGERSEIFGRRKDGTEFLAEASISKLEVAGEQILTAFLRDITVAKQLEEGRQQAEAKLQAQRQFLRQVIDSVPNLIFVKAWDGRFTLANQALAEVYHTTVGEIIGRTDIDFCPNPADAEQYARADRHVMQTLQPLLNLEESFVTGAGTIRWFQSNKKPLISPDGTRYVLGVCNDITTLKETEAALQQKTEELEVFFSSAIDLLCIANIEGYLLRLNPEWERSLGYKLSDLEGKRFLDFVHPDDLETTLTVLSQLSEQQTIHSFVNRYRHHNGSYRWIEWRSVPRGNYIYAAARDITDRKHAEAELQLSQERLQLAVEASGEGLWDWQIDTGEVYRSHQYLENLGYDAKELPENVRSWEESIHPDDKARVFNLLNAHFQDSSLQFACEYRMQTKSGEWKWIADYGKVVTWDEQGKPLRMIGTHKDISDRKQAEAALRLTDFSFESSSAPAAWIKPDASIMRVNAASCQTLGYSREELQSMHVYDLDPNFPVELWSEHWQELKRQKHLNFVTQQLTKDGKLLPVEVRLNYVEFDGEEYNFASMQDISERLQAEAVLRESEERFRSAFDYSAIGMALVGLDGQWLKVNSALCEIVGYCEEELSTLTFQDITYPDDLEIDLTNAHQLLAGEIRTYQMEKRYVHKQGQIVWILLTGSLVRNSQNEPLYFIAQIQDVTERKSSEAALRVSEERWRYALEGNGDGLWDWNIQNNEIFFSRQWRMMHGCAEDEISNDVSEWDKRIHPDDKASVYAAIRKHISGEVPQYISEYRILCKHGTYKWILDRGMVMSRDQDGKPLRVMGTHTDISDRKQIEQALRESEIRFRTLIEDLQVGVVVHGPQAEIQLCNSKALNLLGLTEAQFLGKTSFDPDWSIIHEDGSPFLSQAHPSVQAITTARSVRNVIMGVHRPQQNDRVWLLVDAEPQLDTEGNVQQVICTFSDISDRQAALRERERAKAELQQREQELRALVENAPDIIMRLNYDCRYLYINPTVERHSGIPAAAFINKTIQEFGAPEALVELWRTNIHKAFETGQEQKLEFEIPTSTGIIYYATRLVPEFANDGSVQSVLAIARDISDYVRILQEREQAERLLRQSETRLRLALKAAKFGTWEFNFVTSELFQSDISEIYGLEPGQTHKTYAEWQTQIHPDDRDWVQAEFDRAIQAAGEFSFEFRIVRPDATVRWTLSTGAVVHNQTGQPLYAYGIAADITDRKLAEVEQKVQQAFLRQVIDTVPNIIFVKNKTGHILIVNQAGADAHGTTVDAMIGKRETDFNPNFSTEQLEEFLAINQQVMQTRQPHTNLSQAIVNASGKTCWYQTVINPLVDVDGQVTGIVGATTDVTDLKHTEHALQQAKEAAEAANRAKSIFLANMSHELRTPLNVILGFAQVMHRDQSLTSEQRENLQIIRRSSDHLLNLINDVLDLSKIEAGHLTLDESSVDLIDLLRSLEQMFRQRAETKGLQLHLKLAPNLPQYVTIDANKLRQILINLLGNAIKFTKQGHVTLRVKVRKGKKTGSRHSITSSHPTMTLKFEVSDTGVGIAPTERESIFSAFVQTQAGKISPDGTGLGLTISQKFVQMMGGNITVQSTPGHGSAFMFTIAVHVARSTDISSTSPTCKVIGLASGQTYRILVVDDQPENRTLLVKLLTQIGLEVKEATDGQAAVALWQQWQPHLILMDVRMPRLNGYEATQQIRATPGGQASIIIALTAQASQGDRTLALAAGCNDYLSKPFQDEVLFGKIAEHLRLEYVCEKNQTTSLDEGSLSAAMKLKPADLSTMPSVWIAALRQAARLCDDGEAERLIEQIPAERASLIKGLSQLVQNYKFKQIIALTRSGATDDYV